MKPHAAYPNRAAHKSHGRTESEHNPIRRLSVPFNYFFVLYLRITILSDPMSSATRPSFPRLPCFPCPYNSSCCAYGTTLSETEAAAIEANHGPDLVYKTRWGEWRTRVRNKRCALHVNGGCSIHDKSYYPTLCAGFPWIDSETGDRYEYDVTICGEFEARTELIELQRSIPLTD